MAGRATEDSHKRSATEPSVPRVAMDYGFHGRGLCHDPGADIETLHGAVGACQVLRKGPEPHATDCVLAYLDTWGLGEVLLKAVSEPAIQALVDAVRITRDERTMVGKSPKYTHQSSGAVENAVRRIDSLTRTHVCVCVLQEKLGYKVDSKSIALPWLVRHAGCVLSRFVKRDDGRNACGRLRSKECDRSLAQVGETVDFKIVRGEMAKLEARWATGTFLGWMKATRSSWGQQSGSSLLRRDKQRCIHDIQRCALESMRTCGGGSSEQEEEVHHKEQHGGRQAAQHVWECPRSTRQRAEKDSNPTRPV